MSRVLKDVQLLVNASKVGSLGVAVADGSQAGEETQYRVLANQIVADAKAQGAALVAEAQERSRSLLAEAQVELAGLRQKAWDEGYAQGLKEGEQQAQRLQREAEALKEEARYNLALVQAQQEAWTVQAEPELIKLALALAEKIVTCQLDIKQELILAMLKGLELDTGGEEVVVKVNPSVLSFLEKNHSFLSGIFTQGGYRLEGDTGIDQGIVLETRLGTVDARVKTQLEQLAHSLTLVVENA